MKTSFMSSKTKTVLMRAFAAEGQARNRYVFAADEAQQQNYIAIARLFRMTAAQEEQHAKIFFKLMKEASGNVIDISAGFPADVSTDVIALLDIAVKDENEEAAVVYPEFAAIAAEEGFTKAASKFELIGAIENEHKKRFEYYASLMKADRLFRSDNSEERWICLNCGHIHTSSEAPMTCPVCGAKQGYFVREGEAAFTFGGMLMQ